MLHIVMFDRFVFMSHHAGSGLARDVPRLTIPVVDWSAAESPIDMHHGLFTIQEPHFRRRLIAYYQPHDTAMTGTRKSIGTQHNGTDSKVCAEILIAGIIEPEKACVLICLWLSGFVYGTTQPPMRASLLASYGRVDRTSDYISPPVYE